MSMKVKPTRSELIKLKKQIKLAKSGYNLLKKKRDGLIMEFFEILKKAKTLRKEMTDEYAGAVNVMNMTRVIEGDIKLKSIAMAVKDRPSVQLEQKNIMGVVVPKISSVHKTKYFMERGYGILDSSAAIDEATLAYETVLAKVIEAAETETALKKMLGEIEKTKRRVNALEFAVIPKMEEIRDFITFRLEELERENIMRLKHIKG